jgi:hypothetical protein
MRTPHWTALKKQVEALGGEYTGVDQALLFLREKGVSVEKQEDPVKLDKTRDYGVVIGEVEEAPTARFAQDGHLFDVNGNKVG